jgi:hypothetical protein
MIEDAIDELVSKYIVRKVLTEQDVIDVLVTYKLVSSSAVNEVIEELHSIGIRI